MINYAISVVSSIITTTEKSYTGTSCAQNVTIGSAKMASVTI